MRKLLLFFAFISLLNPSFSQIVDQDCKNRYIIGFNRSFLTTGDRPGFHFTNEYQRLVANNFGIGINIGILYSVKESSIIYTVPDYPSNIITGDWMLTTEDGTKILKTKTDQQTYIHSDLLFSYSVLRFNKIYLNISAGGSIAYISNSFLTRWELGTFNGMNGLQNLQLYYPYYSRFIDLGVTLKLNSYYKISDKLLIGIIGGVNGYFKSGYRFYDIGIIWGINF